MASGAADRLLEMYPFQALSKWRPAPKTGGRSPLTRGNLGSQRGQAIVLVLLLSVVGVLVALSLVDTGILVSEKMQLQNAADATAFSVSTLEARDLNFSAYTNRAMVANEVGIGQLVGLMSWSVMLDSVPGYVTSLPVVGQYLSLIKLAGPFLKTIRTGVQAFATGAANPFAIPTLHKLNAFYSSMQAVMHIATLSVSAATLFDMIAENAKDARISLFGYLALARHFTSYYSELTGGKLSSYVVNYSQDSPPSAAQQAGMRRLASVVNASRDPFTRDRAGGWSLWLIPKLRIHPPEIKIKIGKRTICLFCVDITFGVSVDRRGGSDMRFVERNRREQYGWSAVDTLGGNVHLKWKVIIAGVSVPSPHIPLGYPLGIGGAMAGGDRYTLGELLPKPIGDVPLDAYGSGPKDNAVAWLWLSSLPGDGGPYFAVNHRDNNVGPAYPGLPAYQDARTQPWPIAIDNNKKLGWEAPYLLIALYKPSEKIPQSQAKGRFDLDPGTAHAELHVLGKSEVYFSRPTDLTYFARADHHIELANTFNPYWDARLVDTSYIDRVVALSMGQEPRWALLNVARPLQAFQQLLSFVPGLRGL